MSNALENKVDKILDYLVVMTRENDKKFAAIDKHFDAIDMRFDAIDMRFDAIDKRFDAIDKRFDAVEADLSTLKGATRRIEERQKLMEKSIGILQEADRARQDDIQQLNIRVERIEEHLKSLPTPH